jgi:hypothetical protein
MAGMRYTGNGRQRYSLADRCSVNLISWPVFSLYELKCAKFARKNPEKFVKNSHVENNPTRSTRNNPHARKLPVCETSITSAQNPLIMVARIYNKLP